MISPGKQTILFCSVFYPRTRLHNLLASQLAPLAVRIRTVDPYARHVVHFSHARGCNIALSWYLTPALIRQTSELIDSSINLYLTENPSKPKLNRKVTGLFTDFETNTLRYNLHRFPLNLNGGIPQSDADELVDFITMLIYELLSSDPVDDGSIFTLSFYLHAVIAMHCIKNGKELVTQLKEKLPPSPGASGAKYFVDNYQLLREIIADMSSLETCGPFDRWRLKCCPVFSRNQAANNGDDLEVFHTISDLITSQLGLNAAAQRMILLFISKVLDDSWEKA